MPISLNRPGDRVRINWNGREVTQTLVRLISSRVSSHASRVTAEAKRLAPVDTGQLRDSIYRTPVKVTQDKISATIETDTSDLHNRGYGYGGFVEVGTRRTPAQPFIFPAFNLDRPRFKSSLERII